MSKKKDDKDIVAAIIAAAVTVAVNIRNIVWLPAYNYARPEGVDLKNSSQTISLLATYGWMTNEVADVLYIGDKPQYQEQAVKFVENQLKALWDKAQSSADAMNEYNSYKERFGNISADNPPEYLGITANRRGHCAPLAAIEWQQKQREENKGKTGNELVSAEFSTYFDAFDVTCRVHKDLTEAQWIGLQVQENQLKAAGAVKMTVFGLMVTATKLIDLGQTINTLRKEFGGSDGQRAGYLAILQNRFPNLGLFVKQPDGKYTGRLVNSDDPKFINWTRIPYARLPRLVRGTDPVELKEWNDKLKADALRTQGSEDKAELEPLLTEEDVDKALEGFMGRGATGEEKKKDEPVRMDAKRADNLRKNNSNEVIKALGDVFLSSNEEKLQQVQSLTLGMNALMLIGYDESLHVSLDVLSRLSPEDRTAAIAEISQVVASYQPAKVVPTATTEGETS